jgi:hypothetical protein
MKAMVAVCLCVLLGVGASPARGDFKYSDTAKITGGTLKSMMKTVGLFSKQASQAMKPVTQRHYVPGNFMRSDEPRGKVQIIDLGGRRILEIDPQKRSYEMKAAMQRAQERAQQKDSEVKPESKPASDSKADANNSGANGSSSDSSRTRASSSDTPTDASDAMMKGLGGLFNKKKKDESAGEQSNSQNPPPPSTPGALIEMII